MRRRSLPAAAGLLLLAAAPAPAAGLSADQAAAAASTCEGFGRDHHYPPLSIAVLDIDGTLLRFVRGDGASPATADAALLKARSALRMRRPTALLGTLADDPAGAGTLTLLGIATIPGGVPIALGDGGIAGAIGVSGSRNEDDARCAAAGAAALAGVPAAVRP